MFQADVYFDMETGRNRWAVLHIKSGVWYFPERYGQQAARKLASKLNKESRD